MAQNQRIVLQRRKRTMKNYLLILMGILFVCCQSQPERPFSEAEKLADKQYYQFFHWMLFGDGDKDTAVESLFKSAEAGYAESQSQLILLLYGGSKRLNKKIMLHKRNWRYSM